MKIINGRNKALGRVGSKAVEEALKGKKVRIINSEDIIVTGKRENIIEKYRDKFNLRDIGNPRKSPKTVSRRPDLFVKKAIRNMIPREKKRGKKAERRIKAYLGDPEEMEEEAEEFGEKKTDIEHLTVEQICKELGKGGKK